MKAFLRALLALGPRDRFDPPRARSVETLAVTAERLLERLDAVRANGDGRWMARCPAHEDRSPSLSVRETRDGTVLIHCFAGCSAADVVTAVGLEFRDLFPPSDSLAEHRSRPRRVPPMSAASLLSVLSRRLSGLEIALADLESGQVLSARDRATVRESIADIRHMARQAEAFSE